MIDYRLQSPLMHTYGIAPTEGLPPTPTPMWDVPRELAVGLATPTTPVPFDGHTRSEDHGHGHGHETTAVSKAWRAAAAIGNLAIGAAELVTGGGASTLAVLGDGMHNIGDAGTYWAQASDVHHGRRASDRRRKAVYSIITASSLWVVVQAGVDIAQEVTHSAAAAEDTTAVLYAAGASATLNAGLAGRLYFGIRRERAKRGGAHVAHENDLWQHIVYDSASAAAAVAGVLAQRYNLEVVIGIDNVAAMLGGAAGVWAFRPTKKNLQHDHQH